MFVRRWLPYMRDVPDTWLFEPSLMPQNMQTRTSTSDQIPQPMVDLALATRASKQLLHARRGNSEVKAGKKALVEKHASRQTFRKRPATEPKNAVASSQLGFDF
jgi:deoxyribodipyrimidine photo-lyase